MDIKDIKDILQAVSASNVTQFEYKKNGVRLSLNKGNVRSNEVVESSSQTEVVTTLPSEVSYLENNKPTQLVSTENNILITAPLVGVFYVASSPESEPFVKVGQVVKKGQTVCLVEAMKVLNEIKAPEDGKVLQVSVQNGDVVEFGQLIMELSYV